MPCTDLKRSYLRSRARTHRLFRQFMPFPEPLADMLDILRLSNLKNESLNSRNHIMRNLNSRVRTLENANGFRNEAQRQEYLQYTRRINPGVTRDDIRSEKDYITLQKNHLSQLPHEYAKPDASAIARLLKWLSGFFISLSKLAYQRA